MNGTLLTPLLLFAGVMVVLTLALLRWPLTLLLELTLTFILTLAVLVGIGLVWTVLSWIVLPLLG